MSDQRSEISGGQGQHARDGASLHADAGGGLLPPAPPAPWPLALLGDVVDWTVVVIGAVMIGLVFFNVLLHVVGKDLAAVTELAELLMVWVTFLGGACATRRGAQMTITEFIDMTRGGVRSAADAAVDVLAIVVLGLLVGYGVSLAVTGWGNELTVLGVPMTLQYLGMPVGCLAMLAFVLWDLIRILRGDSREQRWGRPEGGS
jgi:TRAP-type C4-dicarboxylate transport system permease small subunit